MCVGPRDEDIVACDPERPGDGLRDSAVTYDHTASTSEDNTSRNRQYQGGQRHSSAVQCDGPGATDEDNAA